MARKFLYFVAVVIAIIIAGAIALSIWSREATQIALVPRGAFVEQSPLAESAYQDPAMWYSRPGIGTSDPARYQPSMKGVAGTDGNDEVPGFAVFFVPPTSYIQVNGNWNATLDDRETDDRARVFLRGLASPFNRADEIWAPRYRDRRSLFRRPSGLSILCRQRRSEKADRTCRAQPGRRACPAAVTRGSRRDAARGARRGCLCARLANIDRARSACIAHPCLRHSAADRMPPFLVDPCRRWRCSDDHGTI